MATAVEYTASGFWRGDGAEKGRMEARCLERAHGFRLDKKSSKPLKTEQVVTDYCCDIQGGTGKEQRTCIALDRSIKQSYDYFIWSTA